MNFPKSKVEPNEILNPMLHDCHAMNAKELVLEYLATLDRKDFKSARSYVSDNISYVGSIGSFDGADPYFKYLEHLDLPKMEIKKVFTDGQDVCVLHELNFGSPPATMFVCTWCHVDDGKISSMRVIFDPRPWIEREQRK
ncbi:MAG TPA: nuclear transport factor 2 family protein [Candidatus Nitrosopolaris sp.]|nr:nuclear transport factor 2 family protein [Candidatus Nitrosopolaris sp.]